MGHYYENSLKDVLINILLVIVLVLLLILPGYLCYKLFIATPADSNTEPVVEKNDTEQTGVFPEEVQEEESTPALGEHFVEYFPIIQEQQAYVIAPKVVSDREYSILVVYSHGSNTTVSQDMSDPFMQDLKEYGYLFTQYNYIFAASNQHGVNWGNEASLRDTSNLIDWVSQNYNIHPQINMIGFSMGGLPTMNFVTQNSESISKVALLAPTVRASEWSQARADELRDVEVKIWHGTKDVNVPYTNSVGFINRLKAYGKDIELVSLEGKTHFDIDTEYMNDVLVFFES